MRSAEIEPSLHRVSGQAAGFFRVRYGWPPMVTVPAPGASRPTTTRMVVDLPAPFGPAKPVTWPGRTVNVTSSSAYAGPNRLRSPSISVVAFMGVLSRPARTSLSRRIRARACPVGASRIRSVRSVPPVASQLPSGATARARTVYRKSQLDDMHRAGLS